MLRSFQHKHPVLFLLIVLGLLVVGCDEACTALQGVSHAVIYSINLSDARSDDSGDANVLRNGPHEIRADYRIGSTGIFTPTELIGMNFLERNGYLAVLVPHLPSAEIPSHIASPEVHFSYHYPPNAALTTVAIPLMRRDEYLPMLNAKFPVEDGMSHWEAWWLPPGEKFPLPPGPFRVDANENPAPIEGNFVIDFGNGADARQCAGCRLAYLFFNGVTFIGPHESTMRVFHPFQGYALNGNPLVAFDQCGIPYPQTMSNAIAPSTPFTQEHCLTNGEAQQRTYTLSYTSSQNWNYTLYSRSLMPGSQPQPIVGNQVTLESTGQADSSKMILAVYTPNINPTDSFRETFRITATSNADPNVDASADGWAFTPGYRLTEGCCRLVLPLGLFEREP